MLDLSEDDSDLIKCLLYHIYGAEWDVVSRLCISASGKIEADMRKEVGKEYDEIMNKMTSSPDKWYLPKSYGTEIKDHTMPDAMTPIYYHCLLYTSPSPRDGLLSRMPSSA